MLSLSAYSYHFFNAFSYPIFCLRWLGERQGSQCFFGIWSHLLPIPLSFGSSDNILKKTEKLHSTLFTILSTQEVSDKNAARRHQFLQRHNFIQEAMRQKQSSLRKIMSKERNTSHICITKLSVLSFTYMQILKVEKSLL